MAEASKGQEGARRAPEPDPLWRKGYDTFERSVAPTLSNVLRSDEFAQVMGAVAHLQHTARAELGRATRRWLHLWNLPAATDVTRILNELGHLEQQVRLLRQALDAKEVTHDGDAPRPGAARRSRPA